MRVSSFLPPLRGRCGPWVLLILLLLLGVRFFAFEGWVWPVRVVGGSMADSFLGAHYRICCGDCGFVFHCGAEYVPSNRKAVCPNCGFRDNELEESRRGPGQRVLIDRWSGWTGGAELWQPLAFTSASRAEYLAIKRVVAKGEGRVGIQDGEVFLDGRIQRKTLAQFRQLRLLVHDDRYRPTQTKGLPDRWRAAEPDSPWRATDSGYQYVAKDKRPNSAVDWLEYRQWTCWPNRSPPAKRTAPTPILDHYAYNQSLSRSRLHEVGDIMLQCELTARGRGRVVLRFDDGADRFQFTLNYPDRSCYLRHNGKLVGHVSRPTLPRPWRIEFGVCDQRVFASMDQTVLFQRGYQPAEYPRREVEVASPLAVGAAGLEVQFEAPRIYRDVYYLGPGGERRWVAPDPLAPDEYFVIGDNVPVSIDCRRIGPLREDSVRGPVFHLGD
ncbi:MAG: S26 family signal peptidase [Planctomycetota bacterium]